MTHFGKVAVLTAGVLVAAASGLLYEFCGIPVHFSPRAPTSWHTAFVGDSITMFWDAPAISFGHPGYTTQRLLVVFDHRVRCRCYRNLVLLGGTNDVVEGVDPAATIANLRTMIRAGRDQSARVFIGTIPPIGGRFQGHDQQVAELNRRIATLAADEGATLLNFNAALTGHPEDFKDGVHPNRKGYRAMEEVLRQNGLMR